MVTLSSFEAESVSLSEQIKYAKWWTKVFHDYRMKERAMTTFVDNQGLVDAVNGQKNTSMRLKHLDVRYKFSREAITDKVVMVEWIPGTEMIADIFTKPLGRILFLKFRNEIGVKMMKMRNGRKEELEHVREEEKGGEGRIRLLELCVHR